MRLLRLMLILSTRSLRVSSSSQLLGAVNSEEVYDKICDEWDRLNEELS